MAKQAKRKVGFLNSATPEELAPQVAAFLRGLTQAGFAKKDVDFIDRFAKHKLGDLPNLADKLVKANVEVIAATGGIVSAKAAVTAVKAAGKSIRIVYVSGYDPTASEALASGGNTTGVITATTEHLQRIGCATPGHCLAKSRRSHPYCSKKRRSVSPRGTGSIQPKKALLFLRPIWTVS